MQRSIGMKFYFLCATLLWASSAQASFHLYDIREIYSNGDGSIQFVELFTANNGQQFLDGHTVVASQSASTNTFTFVGSGPSPTGNRPLLLATSGFAAACGITPDHPGGQLSLRPGWECRVRPQCRYGRLHLSSPGRSHVLEFSRGNDRNEFA